MSKVIPLVSLLHRAAAATEHQGSSLSAQLALQIQRRFRGIETCHSLAASTFLDVRFKNLAFRDKDNVENMKKRLLTEMQETYQLTSESSSAAPQAAASSSAPSSASARQSSSASSPGPSSASSPAPSSASARQSSSASASGPSYASPGSPAPTSSAAQVKKGIWADFGSPTAPHNRYRLRLLKCVATWRKSHFQGTRTHYFGGKATNKPSCP